MTSNSVIRSAQKTGGLFDAAQDDKATIADFKNELETGDIWEGWPDLSSYTTEACGIFLDENSLDQFMDLSQLLSQEPLGSGALPAQVDDPQVKMEIPLAGVKRKRSPSVISDHDYVLKKPRVAEWTSGTEGSVLQDKDAAQPSTSSVDRYKERRRKNNIASRRSREIRKQKFADMETEADNLESENRRLEVKIVEMERLAKEMKAILVKSLVNKK
ncbi:uncharacterized protein LOC135476201 [Liolophura sinensis]|uniref:uncharacterized protein LOC135476201 n=1 Tax=Liolophura sinensis TaxID=3198878 RepID=UPI0031591EE4